MIPTSFLRCRKGAPHTLPLDQDAAHFLISQVHAHPHQVTICALGPLTNIALALSIDPHFAELTQGIYLMGGSLDPQTADPEFSASPRHEFNFWFDPEAAHIVLRAHWPRIDVTTVDVSIKGTFTQKMVDDIAQSSNPAAQYIVRFSKDRYYLWDELTASTLLDPSIITTERLLYMDVDMSHGPSYGNTLTWTAPLKPETDVQLVHAQMDLDLPKFTSYVRRPDESAPSKEVNRRWGAGISTRGSVLPFRPGCWLKRNCRSLHYASLRSKTFRTGGPLNCRCRSATFPRHTAAGGMTKRRVALTSAADTLAIDRAAGYPQFSSAFGVPWYRSEA